MPDTDDRAPKHPQSYEVPGGEDPESVELAYQLQISSSNDPEIIERLVRRYASDLYRWIEVLLYNRQINSPSQELILKILAASFSFAASHVDQFHGRESILDWLFAIAYRVVKGWKLKSRPSDYPIRGMNREDNTSAEQDSSRRSLDILDHLTKKNRLPIILRYLFNLEISDIADILNLPGHAVHQRMVGGRNTLLPQHVKAHLEKLIQADHDGLLDNPRDLISYREHLTGCSTCQQAVEQIEALEKSLAESLQGCWPSLILSDDDLNSLVKSISNDVSQLNPWREINLPIRQLAWVFGSVLVLAGFVFIFTRLTAIDDRLSRLVTTPKPSPAPAIELPPIIGSSSYSAGSVVVPQFIEPAFSSDGRWAVFTEIKDVPGSQVNLSPTIELYNRDTNTIKVIGENLSLHMPWIWWDMAPSISGDGRWIVYVGSTNEPHVTGEHCETPVGVPCMDIFLYDREKNTTLRLSRSFTGAASNGDSLAPTISEDGNWVAFWSAASNLVGGFNTTCPQTSGGSTCWYIYLDNLITGNIQPITIPNGPTNTVNGLDRISLSADGRYVGFTLSSAYQADAYPSPTPLSFLNQANSGTDMVESPSISDNTSSEAVVYDRETGQLEYENQDSDSTPGNGSSSSPVLSADGRYVAFISQSTNLAPNDTNNSRDVFLRDRQTGKVELVSVSSSGELGSRDSGMSYWFRSSYNLNISSDGRYVIFESIADNLAGILAPDCSGAAVNVCNIIYIHDRQTGSTQWISAVPNQNYTLYPQISADGRWVTFMQTFSDCSTSPEAFCSNVMLYDRQSGWTTNLTRFNVDSPQLPWSFSGMVSLPRQDWESSALAISPDGKLIAVGGNDGSVRLWLASSVNQYTSDGIPASTLESGSDETLSALAFSPDGTWLAGGTTKGSVYIWSLSDGALVTSLPGRSDLIRKLVFSTDGSQLVAATLSGVNKWSLYADQLHMVNSISFGTTAVYAVDFSISADLVATARGDGMVWLQNLSTGNVLGRLGAGHLASNSLAFSVDGSLLATNSLDSGIILWRVRHARSMTPLISQISAFPSTGYVGTLTFSPDNKYLASTGDVGGVDVWSVTDRKLSSLSTSVPDGRLLSIQFAGLGDNLAVTFEKNLAVWVMPDLHQSAFYVHATGNDFVDTEPLPTPSANDVPGLQPQANRVILGNLSLDQAAALLAFPLVIPSHLPENISYLDGTLNQDGSILLLYAVNSRDGFQISLYIYEKYIGSAAPPTMTVGHDADLMFTQVDNFSGEAIAEYVQGDWFWRQSFTVPSGDSPGGDMHDVWDWDSYSHSQRLRWEQDGVLIGLYYQVENPYSPVTLTSIGNGNIIHLSSIFDQGDLIQVAAGMMPYQKLYSGLASGNQPRSQVNNTLSSNPLWGGLPLFSPFWTNESANKNLFVAPR